MWDEGRKQIMMKRVSEFPLLNTEITKDFGKDIIAYYTAYARWCFE